MKTEYEKYIDLIQDCINEINNIIYHEKEELPGQLEYFTEYIKIFANEAMKNINEIVKKIKS